MNSVELVKKICKERGIPISRLERQCRFANGYIRRLSKGVFPSDKLQIIADYLDVSVEYLLSGGEKTVDVRADGQQKWYFDDETAQIAQWIADNPEMKAVMYALRDMPPDSARALAETIKLIKGTNIDG